MTVLFIYRFNEKCPKTSLYLSFVRSGVLHFSRVDTMRMCCVCSAHLCSHTCLMYISWCDIRMTQMFVDLRCERWDEPFYWPAAWPDHSLWSCGWPRAKISLSASCIVFLCTGGCSINEHGISTFYVFLSTFCIFLSSYTLSCLLCTKKAPPPIKTLSLKALNFIMNFLQMQTTMSCKNRDRLWTVCLDFLEGTFW